MTYPEIYTQLESLFEDVFLRSGIKLERSTTAKDIEGWDSIKQVEIILAVSEHFGIRLSNREVDNLTSVGDLAEAIHRKTSS